MSGQKLQTKDVNYLNIDFKGFKDKLNTFSQVYFPDISNDFNESSPGQMFVEMSAYVGDVLSFYIDNSLRESLLLHAQERSNVMDIARGVGYKPLQSAPSRVTLDVYVLLPVQGTGATAAPDWRYAPIIDEGLRAQTKTASTPFFTLQPVDFNFSSSVDPTDVSIYKIDSDGNPETYLLKKQVEAKSGVVKYKTFSFQSPKKYDKVLIGDNNVIEVLDCRDQEGNRWYEVDYIAQNMVYEEVKNTRTIDPEFSKLRDETPYLLKLRKTGRRFQVNVTADLGTEIMFGAGNSNIADELIVPNPNNMGLNLPYGNVSAMDNAWDPSNAMFTRAYGQAPANQTLQFKYVVGGGIKDNVPAGTIREITGISFTMETDGLSAATVQFVKKSVAVSNPIPATGGKGFESVEEIRQNAMAFAATQHRAVTREDFIARLYSMPARFGNVAKAFIVQDEQLKVETGEEVANPLALNIYLLSYNASGNLTQANAATKENIRNYLSKFRMLTDAINIKDGFIINIGIQYSIITLPGHNSQQVILKASRKIAEIFDIRKWQFNEPIFLANLATEIDKIEGVQTVQDLDVYCKHEAESGYSGNFYDIAEATKNKIIYPSQDPAIFEVKFPALDIKGRVVTY